MASTKIRFENFSKENYDDLISWIDNEEFLMQFAGPLLNFPLTHEQLTTSLSDKNRIAYRIVNNETNLSIGHCEIYLSKNSAKIGRILIADSKQRGKGLGQEIVVMLLDFIFSNLDRTIVELNVFDWNIAAIKCYKKVGFSINKNISLERKIKDSTWIAINMSIDKSSYEQNKQNDS